MKLAMSNKNELMEISKITADGNRLIVSGAIFGAVPMRAVLTAAEARKALSMMSFKTILATIAILLFR